MLVVVQDVVLDNIMHYLTGHNVLHTFAEDTCEGNWEIVGCLMLFSLFKNQGYICSLPISRHFLFVFGGIVDEGYYWGQDISKLFKNPLLL